MKFASPKKGAETPERYYKNSGGVEAPGRKFQLKNFQMKFASPKKGAETPERYLK